MCGFWKAIYNWPNRSWIFPHSRYGLKYAKDVQVQKTAMRLAIEILAGHSR